MGCTYLTLRNYAIVVSLLGITVYRFVVVPQPLLEPSLAGPHPLEYYQQLPWWFEEDEKLAHADLSGRVAIVTGSSSGIGKGIAKALLKQNCTVVVTSRSERRAQQAVDDLYEQTGVMAEAEALDLSDLDDVARFSEKFVASGRLLNYLVLNAGMGPLISVDAIRPGWAGPWKSAQEYEILYASNYLGHFKLTQQLLPQMKDARPARISATSSISHWYHDGNATSGNILPSKQKKNMENASFPSLIRQYGNTKLAQVLMCFEAQRRFNGSSDFGHVTCTPSAPGLVDTAITVANLDNRNGKDGTLPGGVSTDRGAMINLHALLSPSHVGETGVFLQPYWSPLHQSDPAFGGWEMPPIHEAIMQRYWWGMFRWKPHPDAFNETFAGQLWDETARITGGSVA